jgi:glycosyltransferase involved in cell wall biosynthesis
MIKDGETGRLVDFFDVKAWSATLIDTLANPLDHQPMRDAARKMVQERYDLRSVCLPRQVDLLTRLNRS